MNCIPNDDPTPPTADQEPEEPRVLMLPDLPKYTITAEERARKEASTQLDADITQDVVFQESELEPGFDTHVPVGPSGLRGDLRGTGLGDDVGMHEPGKPMRPYKGGTRVPGIHPEAWPRMSAKAKEIETEKYLAPLRLQAEAEAKSEKRPERQQTKKRHRLKTPVQAHLRKAHQSQKPSRSLTGTATSRPTECSQTTSPLNRKQYKPEDSLNTHRGT